MAFELSRSNVRPRFRFKVSLPSRLYVVNDYRSVAYFAVELRAGKWIVSYVEDFYFPTMKAIKRVVYG